MRYVRYVLVIAQEVPDEDVGPGVLTDMLDAARPLFAGKEDHTKIFGAILEDADKVMAIFGE